MRVNWQTAAALTSLLVAHPAQADLFRRDSGTAIGRVAFPELGGEKFEIDYRSGALAVPGGETASLRPVDLASRPLESVNGRIRLRGSYIFPALEQPVLGTIVIVHGSGDGPRSAYDLWTTFFLAQGWGVVTFDKRGSGDSTGDWRKADFKMLASDLAAVIATARTLPGVAAKPLGLWGISQAGWIIPQVTARGLADFAIVHAGAITTPFALTAEAVMAEMAAYGFSSEEIEKAQHYFSLDAAVSSGLRPYSDLVEAHRRAEAERAEWLLAPLVPAEAPDRMFFGLVANFDPAPFWRRTKVPVLAIYGGKDFVVPARPNQARFEQLPGARDGTFAAVTLPDANHLGMLARTGFRSEYKQLRRFDPSYFSLIRDFLARFAKIPPTRFETR